MKNPTSPAKRLPLTALLKERNRKYTQIYIFETLYKPDIRQANHDLVRKVKFSILPVFENLQFSATSSQREQARSATL